MRVSLPQWLTHPRFRNWTAWLQRMVSNPIAAVSLAGVIVLIVAMTQIAFVVVDQWSERDIEVRSSLVFRSIRDSVKRGLAVKLQFASEVYDREQQIAEFFFDVFCGVRDVLSRSFSGGQILERVNNFVRLFEQVARERRVRLFLIPRAISTKATH